MKYSSLLLILLVLGLIWCKEDSIDALNPLQAIDVIDAIEAIDMFEALPSVVKSRSKDTDPDNDSSVSPPASSPKEEPKPKEKSASVGEERDIMTKPNFPKDSKTESGSSTPRNKPSLSSGKDDKDEDLKDKDDKKKKLISKKKKGKESNDSEDDEDEGKSKKDINKGLKMTRRRRTRMLSNSTSKGAALLSWIVLIPAAMAAIIALVD